MILTYRGQNHSLLFGTLNIRVSLSSCFGFICSKYGGILFTYALFCYSWWWNKHFWVFSLSLVPCQFASVVKPVRVLPVAVAYSPERVNWMKSQPRRSSTFLAGLRWCWLYTPWSWVGSRGILFLFNHSFSRSAFKLLLDGHSVASFSCFGFGLFGYRKKRKESKFAWGK